MARFRRTVPLLLSVPVGLAFLVGLVQALSGTRGETVPEAAVSQAKVASADFLVLALGDSLTRGRGDPRGEGYVGVVSANLKKAHAALRVENLAVDGLESVGLREVLSHPNALSLAARADLILISIGGNDLSHSLSGMASSGPERAVGAAREAFERNLDAILEILRRQNPKAPILLLTLYNPSSSEQTLSALGSSVILDWNAAIERVAARRGARAVPVADLFDGRPDRLSSDHFHPSASAYALIAGRVLENL
jgi:lysophospholipase L1-like esterase